MKRVIVFGATGNLGAYIALHLKSEGYDVIPKALMLSVISPAHYPADMPLTR